MGRDRRDRDDSTQSGIKDFVVKIRRCGARKDILVPAGPGTGVKAGPGVREVLQACGIRNILTKTHGSTNPINLVKATINGLLQLRTKQQVESLRGVKL